MSDLIETLRGCPSTACRDWQCVAGFQVCPHDYDEIVASLETACEKAADEIERLRKVNDLRGSALLKSDQYIFALEARFERLKAALRAWQRSNEAMEWLDDDSPLVRQTREALGE